MKSALSTQKRQTFFLRTKLRLPRFGPPGPPPGRPPPPCGRGPPCPPPPNRPGPPEGGPECPIGAPAPGADGAGTAGADGAGDSLCACCGGCAAFSSDIQFSWRI